MKKVISLLMSFVMLLSVTAGVDLSAYAANATSGKCGNNVYWSYDLTTNTLTISGTGAMNNYDNYDNIPWRGYRENILTVKIETGVTTIGWRAFNGCSSLTSVTIPNSVTTIENHAFWYCSSLTSVTIPNSVTTIGDSAFCDCSSLTSITIPNSVTTIGSEAFYDCRSLTSVTIPNSVTTIGVCAFSGCSSLTSIDVASGNSNYSSKDGVLFNKDNSILIRYPIGNKRTEYNIPNSVTTIGERAFEDCSSLTSVTIPNSVTSIEYHAFSDCSSLTSVTIPNSVTTIGEFAFFYCISLTSVTIPNSVKTIEWGAFKFCSSLTSVTIPNSVTTIGEQTFCGCSSLTSITIPNSVTKIESQVFYGCSSLTSVTIPDSVTTIGEEAFYKCSSLTSAEISNSVTTIENRVFNYCSSLKDVYYSGSEEQWKKISISYDNGKLSSVTIHYNSQCDTDGLKTKSDETAFIIYDSQAILEIDKIAIGKIDDINLRLKNVKVNYGSVAKDFDKEIIFKKNDIKNNKIVFNHKDYNKYIIPSVVSNDSKYINKKAHNVYMTKNKKDGKPYVSSVFVQQTELVEDSGGGNSGGGTNIGEEDDENINDDDFIGYSSRSKSKPKSAYCDVKYEEQLVIDDTIYNVVISAETNNAKDVHYYIAREDGSYKAEITNGVKENFSFDTLLETGKALYAYVVCDGVSSDPVLLKINKKKLSQSMKNLLLNKSTVNILGGNTGKFKLSDNVPLVGGTEVSLDFIKVPVGVEIIGGKVKISIGFDIFGYEESTSADGDSDTEWLNFKSACKSFDKSKKDRKEALEKFRKFKKGAYKGKSNKDTFKTDFLGYLEGWIDSNGQVHFTEVCGDVAAEFEYKVKTQFGPAGVPIFYGYVQAGAEAGAQFSKGRTIPTGDFPFEFDITIHLTPKVKGGSGIGLEGVVSGGLYSKAEMPLKYAIKKKNFTLDISGEIGVEAHYIIGEVSIPIISGTFHLLNEYFGTKSEQTRRRIMTKCLITYIEHPINEKQNESKLLSRDYIDDQQWLGTNNTLKRKARAKSTSKYEIDNKTLETSVNEFQRPKLVTAGDTLMLVWVDDDSTRDTYNRYKLVYSLYKNGSWSAPKAVADAGTMDYAPSVMAVGDDIYVVYQNFNKKFVSYDENTFFELNKSSEIKIAKYNSNTDLFDSVKTVTSNNTFDYNPCISVENSKPVFYWVNCSSDSFDEKSCSIMKCDLDGNVSTVYSGLNYIFELSVVDGDVYYTAETDCKNETKNDLNLYKNNSQITNNDGIINQEIPTSLARVNNTLYYTSNSGIYKVNNSSTQLVYQNNKILGNLQMLATDKGIRAIWSQSSSVGTDFCTSEFVNGNWSEPVSITDSNKLLSQLCVVNYNGTLFGAYNSTERIEEEGSFKNGSTDLCIFSTSGFSKFELSLNSIDENELLNNGKSKINVLVENNGTETLNDVDFEIVDSLGYSQTVTKKVNIPSGDYEIVEFDYAPKISRDGPQLTALASDSSELEERVSSEGFEKRTLTVKANALGFTDSAQEKIGNADLSIDDLTLERVGKLNIITAQVHNLGSIDANNVNVVFKNGDTELFAYSIEKIEPLQTSIVQFNVSDDALDALKDSDENKDSNKSTVIKVCAESAADEVNLGDNESSVIIEKHIHQWNDWKTITEPTCCKNGKKTRTCKSCGETEELQIEPTGNHNLLERRVEPTCTSEGSIIKKCQNDGCSYQETVRIPKKDHTYTSVVTAPTCKEQGYTTYTCSECGNTYKGDYVATVEHSFKDYKYNNDATCTKDGTKTATCEFGCGTTNTVTAPNTAFGHKFVDNEKYCTNGCKTLNPNYKDPTPTPGGGSTGGGSTDPTPTPGGGGGGGAIPAPEPTPDDTDKKDDDKKPETKPNQSQNTSTSATQKLRVKKLVSKRKALVVYWNKIANVSGYQIQVATDKKFKKNKKTVTVAKQNASKKAVKKLKAKKKYFVRVRAYKTVNGKKSYGKWSKIKSVKTK